MRSRSGIVASKSQDGHLRFRREWGLVASLEAPRGASMVAERGWERMRVAKRPDSNGEPIWLIWHDSSSKGSSWALSERWLMILNRALDLERGGATLRCWREPPPPP
eukprot:COSAG02_NODE_13_length_57813_cov_14.298276_7_plen_107_part_00